ncbi:MAG: ArsC/Spx/MgsR family protein [Polyangiales bacterium]
MVEYLKTPPTKAEFKRVQKLLDVPLVDMLRKKESLYKELDVGNPKLTDAQRLDLVLENPVLIERPIVFTEKAAIIGRPPENVLDCFNRDDEFDRPSETQL